MAITRHLAELVLAEHRFRGISGKVLMLGRQTVFMTPDQAQALVERCGVTLRADAKIDYDKMPYGREKRFISDVSFFSLFSDASVVACDVSDSEGADIIFSLSDEPPPPMLGAYDFIYNGSVLDNVFDPAACIRNVSRMMKPDGVIFHYEGAMHFGLAYLKFTPDWLFDFYALNGFADFQGYLCVFPDVHASPWSVYEWSAYVPEGDSLRLTMPMKYPGEGMVVAIAQNSTSAGIHETPIQNIYRPNHEKYQAAYRRFVASPRRAAIRAALVPAGASSSIAAAPPSTTSQAPSSPDSFLHWARQSPLKALVPVAAKRQLLNMLQREPLLNAVDTDGTAPASTPGHVLLGTVG